MPFIKLKTMTYNSRVKIKKLSSFNSTGPFKKICLWDFSLKFIIVFLLGICNTTYSDNNDNDNINNNNNSNSNNTNNFREFSIIVREKSLTNLLLPTLFVDFEC